MAVGIRIKIAGVDAAMFDQLEGAVDARGNRPAGLIFHASGPIDGGWGVLDFWESRADFDRFAQERIGPAMAAAGATAAPDINEFPVHEYLVGLTPAPRGRRRPRPPRGVSSRRADRGGRSGGRRRRGAASSTSRRVRPALAR